MVADKIIGNINSVETGGRKADRVFIEWYEKDKKLLHKETESGEEIGIRVEGHMHDGDILYIDMDRVVYIDILPIQLISIKTDTMQDMGRLCFELGNRHLSLAIGINTVKVPYDEPTFEYLKKLGFKEKLVSEKFVNYTVCHAHQHSHDA